MKAYGKLEVQNHAFLTSALDGGERSPSFPLTKPRCVLNTMLSGPRAGQDALEKRKSFVPAWNRTPFPLPSSPRKFRNINAEICSRRLAGCKYK
jgi:hypothetical protein